ncbi:hypothetical protein [Pseudomonas laurentiana]|uniref:hypothetical protein n=1 Tax=Pseudomonas laurentiana TaxID=2364649 RepID=UPI0013D2E727|nr:hypothetical protein [Pseudomonas laurentiana]
MPSIQMGGNVLLACLMGEPSLEGTVFVAWRTPTVRQPDRVARIAAVHEYL